MPLDPKQQPPYYTPGTPGRNIANTRLYQTTEQAVTDSTNLTEIYPYTIPANTFQNDGDTLILHIAGTSSGSPTSARIAIHIGATTIAHIDDLGTYWEYQCTIIRVSSTALNFVYRGLRNQGIPLIATQSLTHDFSLTLQTNWEIRAPVSGAITALFTYINKQSAI